MTGALGRGLEPVGAADGGEPGVEVGFDGEAVLEEVLGHEAAGEGGRLGGDDVVGALEEGGDGEEGVEEEVEGGFGVEFEGGCDPVVGGGVVLASTGLGVGLFCLGGCGSS